MSHACTHHVDREQVVRSRVIQHGLKLCLQLGRVDSVDALVTRAHHEHVDQRVEQPTDCKQDPVSIITVASGDNTTKGIRGWLQIAADRKPRDATPTSDVAYPAAVEST